MGKTQFCRICRTEKNLKYTTKELRQINKKQLLLAQSNQQGQENNRGSKKLLLTTPTFGNICQICDERIQIFHRLDDGGHESNSDVEIDVVNNVNESLPTRLVETLPNGDFLQRTQRPETPVIVDDDDMLFNIFMQKFDHKTQLPRQQLNSYSQQQIENQFHTTYTPPQSTGGGSEGDESKVVEILTSRESTPVPKHSVPPLTSSSNMIDQQGHRIVAIIELDDFDEIEQKSSDKGQSGLCTPVTSSLDDLSFTENVRHRSLVLSPSKNSSIKSPHIQETCQTPDVEDDGVIVFREVSTENEKTPALKKRKRKVYDEKELRLVASLSLVSSDSEAEDSPVKMQVTKISSTAVGETPTSDAQNNLSCKVCEIKFPDSESLSVHERIHQGVKCTLCQIGFQQVKRLIHHMRRKHRQYNGDTLSEKPRSGQDSCMTIRLRYMQRTTFYECQLCGRIDEIFREHKEHIIEKHPNESKSLKDPMMKQLKCPVCKAKCGAQYLSLCRHLIISHKYQEFKSHLRELVHVSAFGWNAARQQEVAKTAKIFQFIKRKTFFFECKICHKIVAGYQHHLKHANEHIKPIKNDTTINKSILKEITPLKSSLSTASSKNSNLDKLCKSKKKDRVFISKKLREKDNKSKRLVSHTNFNKTKQIEKVIKVSQKIQTPKEISVQKTKFKTKHMEKVKNPIKNIKSKISKSEVRNESRKNIQLNNKLIPKDKQLEKSPNSVKLTKGKSKKETSKIDSKKLKEKLSKIKVTELKPQVKKVKVKNPIRQIHLQKYQCKYCLKKFKGFRLYNLHLLRQHEENEYTKCNKCNKLFTNSANFKEHVKQCPQLLSTSKQKRKFSEQTSLSDNYAESSQSCIKKVPNKSDVSLDNLEENDLWLKDLLKLKEPLEISERSFYFHESSKTTLFTQKPIILQCCYCLHLFANDKDLKEHKKHNHLENPDILIKYKPFKFP